MLFILLIYGLLISSIIDLHKHYEEIKKGGSDVMHQNADSYKAFGHYAKYGATTSMRHTRVLRHKKKRPNLRNQEAV